MTFDPFTKSYTTQIGPFPPQTLLYYYVTATNNFSVTKTPETFDFIVWDNPPTGGSGVSFLQKLWQSLLSFFTPKTATQVIDAPQTTEVGSGNAIDSIRSTVQSATTGAKVVMLIILGVLVLALLWVLGLVQRLFGFTLRFAQWIIIASLLLVVAWWLIQQGII